MECILTSAAPTSGSIVTSMSCFVPGDQKLHLTLIPIENFS